MTSPVGIGMGPSSFAGPLEGRDLGHLVRQSITLAQLQVAEELLARELRVQTAVAEGPPARAIIEDAGDFGAHLIVVGAREQGPIEAAVLGSVSAQIMERAPCSVLVSRGPPVARVLVAADGSMAAKRAIDVVASWPLFATAQIRVLGIDAPPPGLSGPASLGTEWQAADHVVGEAVEQLLAEGRQVEAMVSRGHPHDQIVAAARAWRPDLVVIGSDVHSPPRRAFLGSVAKRVLHRIAASVLVVRPEL